MNPIRNNNGIASRAGHTHHEKKDQRTQLARNFPSLNESFDISMSIQTTKETTPCSIFPKDNIELFRIVKNELVVSLRLKGGIQVTWRRSIFGISQLFTQFLVKKNGPSCDLRRFLSNSQSLIWS